MISLYDKTESSVVLCCRIGNVYSKFVVIACVVVKAVLFFVVTETGKDVFIRQNENVFFSADMTMETVFKVKKKTNETSGLKNKVIYLWS